MPKASRPFHCGMLSSLLSPQLKCRKRPWQPNRRRPLLPAARALHVPTSPWPSHSRRHHSSILLDDKILSPETPKLEPLSRSAVPSVQPEWRPHLNSPTQHELHQNARPRRWAAGGGGRHGEYQVGSLVAQQRLWIAVRHYLLLVPGHDLLENLHSFREPEDSFVQTEGCPRSTRFSKTTVGNLLSSPKIERRNAVDLARSTRTAERQLEADYAICRHHVLATEAVHGLVKDRPALRGKLEAGNGASIFVIRAASFLYKIRYPRFITALTDTTPR